LYSVRPSQPVDFRPGSCPRRQEFRAELAAYRLDDKVCEAPEKGTKEGAEITKKGGETLEEGAPYSTLTVPIEQTLEGLSSDSTYG
jgi:hypothetical protein